jgi:hypothetical protein
MEIPQEVIEAVKTKFSEMYIQALTWEAIAAKIIPLAQLPIAPATEEEIKRFHKDYVNCPSDLHVVSREYALTQFISRRNSPPQVDPLVEKICEVLHAEVTINTPGTTQREVAEKIAAAVRQEHS